jgi:hypothetical protein
MNQVIRRGRTRLHPYVDAALAGRLRAHCAAGGFTESAAVQQALLQYLDRTGDTTLILRRLDRLDRACARTHQDLEILSEAFAVWMKIWFAHTPTIDEDAKHLARRSAESRFGQFVEHVAQRFENGHRFLDDFPREPISDEAELTRIRAEHSRHADEKSNEA